VAAVLFYIFATIMIGSACVVIFARNPVHSVLFLILAFCNGAGLFLLAGAEFLAMILIVVYVGAVAVLFLFVVMMLDVDFAELKSEMAKYMPIGLLVAVILLIQLAFGLGAWVSAEGAMGLHQAPTPDADQIDNTRALGLLLYDKYLYLFQLSGLILLVAMIGAIVLTLRHRRDIKRQNVLHQMWRDPAKALEMVDVKPGQGL
jgi:NADH-quinone oxidoreductase subunit J